MSCQAYEEALFAIFTKGATRRFDSLNFHAKYAYFGVFLQRAGKYLRQREFDKKLLAVAKFYANPDVIFEDVANDMKALVSCRHDLCNVFHFCFGWRRIVGHIRVSPVLSVGPNMNKGYRTTIWQTLRVYRWSPPVKCLKKHFFTGICFYAFVLFA